MTVNVVSNLAGRTLSPAVISFRWLILPFPPRINRHHAMDNTTPRTDYSRARERSQLEGGEVCGIVSGRKINEILNGVICSVTCGLFRGRE